MNAPTNTPWIATKGLEPGLAPMTFVFARYAGEMREQVETANHGHGEAAGLVNWSEVMEYRLKHADPTTAPFDPAAWLAALTADGGAYALAPDGRLWLGGFETQAPIEAHTIHLVGHPDRVEAIKAVVRERCLIG